MPAAKFIVDLYQYHEQKPDSDFDTSFFKYISRGVDSSPDLQNKIQYIHIWFIKRIIKRSIEDELFRLFVFFLLLMSTRCEYIFSYYECFRSCGRQIYFYFDCLYKLLLSPLVFFQFTIPRPKRFSSISVIRCFKAFNKI